MLIAFSSFLLYFTFPVLPDDVFEDFGSSFTSTSIGSSETMLLSMEEEEHMKKVRGLHINYRNQIQELQDRCRRNEQHIKDMERASKDDMKDLLRLHNEVKRLERK